MRYIDFIIQTLAMLIGLSVFGYSIYDPRSLGLIFFVQMFLGPWQLMSSLVSVITKTPCWKLKVIHLLISIIYLLSIYLLVKSDIWHVDSSNELLLIIPAWLLAAFCYMSVWKEIFYKRKRKGSFLPNLSF